jgi:hypothetical protein
MSVEGNPAAIRFLRYVGAGYLCEPQPPPRYCHGTAVYRSASRRGKRTAPKGRRSRPSAWRAPADPVVAAAWVDCYIYTRVMSSRELDTMGRRRRGIEARATAGWRYSRRFAATASWRWRGKSGKAKASGPIVTPSCIFAAGGTIFPSPGVQTCDAAAGSFMAPLPRLFSGGFAPPFSSCDPSSGPALAAARLRNAALLRDHGRVFGDRDYGFELAAPAFLRQRFGEYVSESRAFPGCDFIV